MSKKKLDMEAVAESIRWRMKDKASKFDIGAMQVAMFVMCGGGRVGQLFAETPKSAAIDPRRGKLPFKVKEIYQFRDVLVQMAVEYGLDPNNLPRMPYFHAAGVF